MGFRVILKNSFLIIIDEIEISEVTEKEILIKVIVLNLLGDRYVVGGGSYGIIFRVWFLYRSSVSLRYFFAEDSQSV